MTTATNTAPNAAYEPYQAAAWLLSRHDHAAHLVDRVGSWLDDNRPGAYDGTLWSRVPDLDLIAEGIAAADRFGVEWHAYEELHRPPRDDAAYERWRDAGPDTDNPFALSYLPMSGGEKRFFRMLAILAPGHRTPFHLDDTSGVSLRCCSPGHYGAPRPHTSFGEDWAALIAGAVAS